MLGRRQRSSRLASVLVRALYTPHACRMECTDSTCMFDWSCAICASCICALCVPSVHCVCHLCIMLLEATHFLLAFCLITCSGISVTDCHRWLKWRLQPAGEFKFHPAPLWAARAASSRDLISRLLCVDPLVRYTAKVPSPSCTGHLH